ncbi:MAG TPA: hypothetical protein VGJ84_13380 [Polyangiaceae bacterium]|jgi:hypothetical protein
MDRPLRAINARGARAAVERLRIEPLPMEDVRDLDMSKKWLGWAQRAVEDLSGLRILADLPPERVGSLLYANAPGQVFCLLEIHIPSAATGARLETWQLPALHTEPSPSLLYLQARLRAPRAFQLVNKRGTPAITQDRIWVS